MLAVLPAGCLFDEGPRTGPGLEPPNETASPGGSVGMGVTPPPPVGGSAAAPMPAGGMAGTAGFGNVGGPGASAGTGAAGMTPPPQTPGDPSSSAGGGGGATGTAGSAAGDPDGGATVCEEERVPALAVGQRIIAPVDAGLPDPDECVYVLPVTAAQYLPDRVNLEHTQEGQRQSVPRVDDADACDPVLGGFYYDSGLLQTRIVACPATCARIAQGGMVEIVLGCPTQTLP